MSRLLYTPRLLLHAIRQQYDADKAYLGNFWTEIISKTMYNLVFIVFIDQLFKRVGSIAGYSHNDFMLMYLISQFGFYICYYGILTPMSKLVSMINTGNLDLLLLKPVPHRAFLYASNFRPVESIFTGVPMLLLTASQVNFGTLDLSLASVLLGLGVISCGVIICNTLLTLLVLPAFKTGEATDSLSVFYSISSISQMPYDNLPGVMKVLSVVVLPQLVCSAASTQVILGKGDVTATIMLVFTAAGVSLIVSHYAWRYAMRQYTSASS